ncbi:hypothetical protein COU62_02290 [Candidatus Pacearchaeota archaeon CG10_big_fil_rev_8_21_14_0_10_35_219]|nr:hypothetical protein [Candidatus Pacearchaeota archaeon]OIO41971.1 MAG: hypothetical protein AUJ63_04430 [Candidatus Pacearchaeota archaeon CG1_02_35_32]PIO07798.1 MAG: hypothetical protein COU62_02290 [Candidatus Pacearchaeota archaeon CG10_big_fil_rev_8_21_14_0_10_35_219]PIY81020.1 MAG: hypothetical protein COY79_04400 [Candidatus Pacearchaeota archaeon CG_4_10_14_0_8_um_filter_35_169]PIZ79889.1 MAG: hypothetical protein COY00_02705 [Candidatus Pacearchaeota archaeon CG_4_10_14_0_2_um_filt
MDFNHEIYGLRGEALARGEFINDDSILEVVAKANSEFRSGETSVLGIGSSDINLGGRIDYSLVVNNGRYTLVETTSSKNGFEKRIGYYFMKDAGSVHFRKAISQTAEAIEPIGVDQEDVEDALYHARSSVGISQ